MGIQKVTSVKGMMGISLSSIPHARHERSKSGARSVMKFSPGIRPYPTTFLSPSQEKTRLIGRVLMLQKQNSSDRADAGQTTIARLAVERVLTVARKREWIGLDVGNLVKTEIANRIEVLFFQFRVRRSHVCNYCSTSADHYDRRGRGKKERTSINTTHG